MLDRPALRELFDYTTFTWEAYGRALQALPSDALARPVEGSGRPALRNVLLHIALSWDDWLRNRLGEQDTPDAAPESITSWEDLQEHRRRVRDWLRRIIHGTPEEKLVAQTEPMFVGMPGETLVSPADILEHILLHERGHPGDVTTQLSSLGAAPPSIDYLTYVYFQALSRAQHS